MSLVGNLEDLSLPDILQIVSLSKKSGILTVEREGLQGKIIIREGRVIQTVSPRAGKTVGEILSARGLVRPEDLKKALEVQQKEAKQELLGSILVRMGMVQQETLEKIVQEQIEEAIVYFLSWKEGTFNFELADIRGRGEISVDPQAFILERGIDTQWLVLEGTRRMDEDARGEREPAPAPETPAAAPAAPGGETRGVVVVVDDDPIFRESMKEKLEALRYTVVLCEGVEKGVAAVEERAGASPTPAVLTDIVLPTSDGRGFLGGMELIEKVCRTYPEVPVVALTAYPDANVREQALKLGAKKLVLKPEGAGGDLEAARKIFFEKVTGLLAAFAAPGGEEEGAAAAPERERLLHALNEKKAALADQEGALKGSNLNRDEMTLLRDMLAEIHSPRAPSEIGLLLLRFASELLSRAVLFVVKADRAVGLGGFGVEISGSARGGGVRGVSLPLGEPSVLEDVARTGEHFRGPLVHTAVNRKLIEHLGGETPAEAVAMPLVSGGKVRVILYGDNLPGNEPIPRLQALEIFLSQAGLTLERIFLEKRLQEEGRSPEATAGTPVSGGSV